MWKPILILMFAAAGANATAADKLLEKVRIVVRSSGKEVPAEGRLYKVLEGQSNREFVANVNADGTLDAPYTCKSPVRIWAEPKRQDVTTEDEPRPCSGNMLFQFHVPLFAESPEFTKGFDLYTLGKPGAAQRVFSNVAARAANAGDDEVAAAASNAAVAAAATVLGDKTLSRLVTRDIAQNKGLVLTQQGKKTLKEFQREANIDVTGKLDFPTQKAMEKKMK